MRRAIALSLGLAGCIEPARFACELDDQCGSGHCEDAGYCSFDDATCPSGRRFGAASASLANTCVPGASTVPDASVPDGPPDLALDATPVDAAPTCPAGYVALGIAGDHRYRRVDNAAGWTNQRALCGNEPANVYLAIPDDADELAALIGLATADVWVGLSDAAEEGSFVTVRGELAAYTPWAPGEPDNDGNQDCAHGQATTGLLATAVCGAPMVAVCECEP